MLGGVVVPAVLDGPDPERRPRRGVDPGGGVEGLVDVGEQVDGHQRGTCWVMQCTPPPPWARTAPGTPTTSRSGRAARDRRQRGVALGAVDDGHHGPAVGQVQVQGRDVGPLPVDHDHGEDVDLDDLIARAGEHLDVGPEPVVVGVPRVSRGLGQHDPGTDAEGDVVDVAVGVVVMEQTVGEPEDPLDAQPPPELGLDAGPVEAGVPVGVEQALLRRDHRPRSVHGDGTTLQHEGEGVDAVEAQVLTHATGELGVLVIGVELLAPGVEHGVEPGPSSVPVGEDDGADVPGPRVVDGPLDHVRSGAGRRRLVTRARVRHEQHRLERADGVDHRGVGDLGLGQPVAPHVRPARPGHHAPLVRRPLRRHGQTHHPHGGTVRLTPSPGRPPGGRR